jgi:hypothetical protein
LGTEGAVAKIVAAFEVVVGVVVVVVIVVIVEFLVGVDEAPKRVGPLTAANGDPILAYARKPPPPCGQISICEPHESRPRMTHEYRCGFRSRGRRRAQCVGICSALLP